MKRHTIDVQCTLSAWLNTHADANALSDGRVFLEESGKTPRRLGVGQATLGLRQGQVVRVASARRHGVGGTLGAAPPLDILAQDGGLVVLNKPAGVPTIPDQHGVSQSLLAQLAAHLFMPLECVHPTSRLDREVSGVVVFALDTATRLALAQAREEGSYKRSYVALSSGVLLSGQGLEGAWEARIGRGKTPSTRAVDGPGATHACSHFKHLAAAGVIHAWLLEPQTGRTHQLRVHAAHAGYPLIGDPHYGGPQRLLAADGRVRAPGRIMLHAHRIQALGRIWEAPVPPLFSELWCDSGGGVFPVSHAA